MKMILKNINIASVINIRKNNKLKKKEINQLHREAKEFRKQKIKEVYEKNPIDDLELNLVNSWAEMFKENL